MRINEMRRWLVQICVLLILGAIVNVAVAWGCAAWAGSDVDLEWFEEASEASWPNPRPAGWPETPDFAVQAKCFGITARGGARLEFFQTRTSLGLPLRAMFWQRTSSQAYVGIDVYQATRFSDGIRVPQSMTLDNADWRCFPVLPLWPGFALNTVFYAVVLWLLFAAPFALRRRRRIKRGLCPKCAYDLRGTQANICPECGSTR